MGSKSKIMDFVIEGINETYQGGAVCDLFSGSASLAGALGQQCVVHSNDIQSYSTILANTYNTAYIETNTPSAEELVTEATEIYKKNRKSLGLNLTYDGHLTLDEFNTLEEVQKRLIDRRFQRDWHLFVKYYSGTWWSYDQCLWIDAYRQVCETFKGSPSYSVIMSSLMFAMAYASQGTGHYAQYRDAKTESSLSDILTYRRRSITSYFVRKYNEILDYLPTNKPTYNHIVSNSDYRDCLDTFQGGLVYADPPYCFVHYSRFYHALETLVLYDYPELQVQKGKIVKGRYRENRHQSPFCIKTQVEAAFTVMFEGVAKSDSNLVLSYSNTGMISLETLKRLALESFASRNIEILTTDHKHMTLGRKKDRHRDVKECLVLVKKS
jgi:adenine-specific DNA-methyltransferase